MEEKINVAEILKEKPQGTKLYDLLYNIDVELDTISTTDTETVVWCTNETDNNTTCHRGYSEFGTVRGCSDGLRILLPSKEMRDWSKFAWKKGDILVNKDAKVHIIFDGFDDDTYKNFHGQYYLWEEGGSIVSFEEDENYMQTSDFNKANKEDAQEYIHKIEKELGGNLNMETLEIEKTQSEFKDGDIAFADFGKTQDVFIVSDKTDLYEGYSSFISLDLRGLTLSMGYRTCFFKKNLCELRLATEEEKQQLFDALAKEGKHWDAENKQIVDLPKKCEFKPFDKVICRDSDADIWKANFFSHYDAKAYFPFFCNNCGYKYCLPYNEKTAKLIGTTNNVEG